jgi:hypothetical protein
VAASARTRFWRAARRRAKEAYVPRNLSLDLEMRGMADLHTPRISLRRIAADRSVELTETRDDAEAEAAAFI